MCILTNVTCSPRHKSINRETKEISRRSQRQLVRIIQELNWWVADFARDQDDDWRRLSRRSEWYFPVVANICRVQYFSPRNVLRSRFRDAFILVTCSRKYIIFTNIKHFDYHLIVIPNYGKSKYGKEAQRHHIDVKMNLRNAFNKIKLPRQHNKV